jgi:hypothetical protein
LTAGGQVALTRQGEDDRVWLVPDRDFELIGSHHFPAYVSRPSAGGYSRRD